MNAADTPQIPPADFEQMRTIATEVVDVTIRRLPEPLLSEAQRIGYELARLSDNPRSLDNMGEYSRSAQRIWLFLPVIREYCLEEQLDFADQVQRTYLHELGHHIGLDEEQLELRGL